MKIIHNIALSVNNDIKQKFLDIGVQLDLGFSNFKIDESDSRWKNVNRLAKSLNAIDTISTHFSVEEYNNAEYIRIIGNWHQGYPQPSKDFKYLSEVYNLENYCSTCGNGLVQKNPFKFSKEPKWGKKSVLQLNWVFDEFFVSPATWELVFKPFGVEFREVLHARSSTPLKSVVQLVIPDKNASLLFNNYNNLHTCICCSTYKLPPISRGFFPALNLKVNAPIFKINDNFGSGANSYKAVIISKDLYSLLNKYKGVTFYPLENI